MTLENITISNCTYFSTNSERPNLQGKEDSIMCASYFNPADLLHKESGEIVQEEDKQIYTCTGHCIYGGYMTDDIKLRLRLGNFLLKTVNNTLEATK